LPQCVSSLKLRLTFVENDMFAVLSS